jgi:hypothetical protein
MKKYLIFILLFLSPYLITNPAIASKTIKPGKSKILNIVIVNGATCLSPETLGKIACEAGANMTHPNYIASCTATDVKLNKDCEVTDAVCKCNLTPRN